MASRVKSSPAILRHTFVELIRYTGFAVLVLTSVLVFGNLLRHEDSFLWVIEQGDQSILEFALLLIPYALSMSIPFGFTVALALLIGQWAYNREISALRSLGVSNFRLAVPVLAFSLILSFISLFSSLHWGPVNRAKFDLLREKLAWTNLSTILERDGEISFRMDGNQSAFNTNGISSISGLDEQEVERVSLSVAQIDNDQWRNLRICLHRPDGKILLVLNARDAIVSRNLEEGILSLDLRHIDMEPVEEEEDFFQGSNSIYVSLKELRQPLSFRISEGKEINLKRLGFIDLYEIIRFSGNSEQSLQAKTIVSKNTALGLSPLFVCIFLLPISVNIGLREPFHCLLFGVFVCITYFIIGTVTSNLWKSNSFSLFSWWFPNILFFITTLVLLAKRRFVNS